MSRVHHQAPAFPFQFPFQPLQPQHRPAHHAHPPHPQQDTYEAGHHRPVQNHHHHQNGQRLHVPAQGIGGRHQQGQRTGPGAAQAAPGGNLIASNALNWNNRSFKPGQSKRCADWVSNILVQSGAHFQRTESAAGFANQGTAVSRDNLKPGDVVLFGNTYKRGKYTHVGIYVGNGLFEHRPTANRPVSLGSLDTAYWRTHYTAARRF